MEMETVVDIKNEVPMNKKDGALAQGVLTPIFNFSAFILLYFLFFSLSLYSLLFFFLIL